MNAEASTGRELHLQHLASPAMRKIMAGAVLVLGLFGCSSDDGGEEPRLAEEQPDDTTTETLEAEETTTTEAEEEATTTTTEAPDFVVGDRVESALGNFVTVYSYEQPAAPNNEFLEPGPGNEFAVADIEACLGVDPPDGNTIGVNPFDFELIMPDNTRRQAAFAVRDPALNFTELFAAGDCVRGFVSFEVPVGVRPSQIVDLLTDPQIRWNVPPA